MDDTLSREKKAVLTSAVNALRQVASVDFLPSKSGEDEIVEALTKRDCDLLFAPWHHYLAWTKVEGFFGWQRTHGPTFAGYSSEPVSSDELGDEPLHLRTLLFDLFHFTPQEISTLVHCLIDEKKRGGIQPFFSNSTRIYCENWYANRGLGSRLDSIFEIPELMQLKWNSRFNAFRVCLCALWSLVYEYGPGKSELTTAQSAPRAYFQIAADSTFAMFRLYYMLSGATPKAIQNQFWYNRKKQLDPAQLLLKYSDFLRVHTIADSLDVEIVVGFCASNPAEKSPDLVRTLWVDPLSSNLMTEKPYEAPGSASSRLRLLPSLVTPNEAPRLIPEIKQDPHIGEAASKIRELKGLVEKRDALIQEMRSGGVGTAKPLGPPGPEELLEAFQQKYFEAKFQIRQFEVKIQELEKKGGSPKQIEELRAQMNDLAEQEQMWIDRLADTLRDYKRA